MPRDTSTVTVTGTVGVLRALKSPLMERCIQLEASGGSLQEMSNLYRPGYAIGMVQGNMTEGTFVCGAGAGLIKEIKGAAEVVRDIVKEAEQIIAALRWLTYPVLRIDMECSQSDTEFQGHGN